jgi:predicted neuraminidase
MSRGKRGMAVDVVVKRNAAVARVRRTKDGMMVMIVKIVYTVREHSVG